MQSLIVKMHSHNNRYKIQVWTANTYGHTSIYIYTRPAAQVETLLKRIKSCARTRKDLRSQQVLKTSLVVQLVFLDRAVRLRWLCINYACVAVCVHNKSPPPTVPTRTPRLEKIYFQFFQKVFHVASVQKYSVTFPGSN